MAKFQKREKKDVAQIITDKIIAMLEDADANKWERPWNFTGLGLPHNAVTGKAYRGTNWFWLMVAGGNFASNAWAGYNQWKTIGATVRGGEKATSILVPIVYNRKDSNGDEITDANAATEKGMTYKSYPVFNAEQVDGYEAPKTDDVPLATRIDHAEKWIANANADTREGNDGRAYYNYVADFISMPPLASFKNTEGYYATILHELTHWTGHESRCDRNLKGNDGADRADYALKELAAEIASAMQCSMLGITSEPRPDHAHYIKGWLKRLKNDKRAIIKAATLAQKAIDHLEGLQK